MIDQATIDRILDAAQIVDVVSEFVTLRKRWWACARSIMKKPLLSAFPPRNGYVNALAAGKEEMPYTSLWNTSRCRTTKH